MKNDDQHLQHDINELEMFSFHSFENIDKIQR